MNCFALLHRLYGFLYYHDISVLMCIYPKRGPLAAVDLVNAEYTRLQTEVFNESKSCMLHQVDILQGLKELDLNASLQGDKQKD